jgi:CHAT domain-containing protein
MDDRGVQFHEVGIDPDRFDLLCRTFEETLATPASSEASIRFYGDKLAGSLLAPVASELDPHRTLVFDLDDSMEFLPVAALPVKGRYLGLQVPVSTVHSVLLASRHPGTTNASLDSVVVGASDPGDTEVPLLPEARAEALAVAAVLARPKVFVGGDALATSIEAAAPHAALLHFAGHTRLVDGGTRLLLAQPVKSGRDWLDARAFRSRSFANCRLVVLSACSTGKREERDSDDIQDIVQTLAAEGTQQIVATHWDVDSAASVSLMKEFYSGLARGLTVPQAMLQAKKAVSTTAEYRHPYFWAPYYVIGLRTTNLKELFHDD